MTPRKAIAGIYKITNLVNGKIYIGKSVNIPARWRSHKSDAGRAVCKSALYNAIRKHGLENFLFETVEIVASGFFDKKEINLVLIEKERLWIKMLDARNPIVGYNLTDGGEGAPGVIPSEETRKKLSLAGKGRIPSEQEMLNKKEAGLRRRGIPSPRPEGWKYPEHQKEAISRANTGRKRTPEQLEKMKQSRPKGPTGRTYSPEKKASWAEIRRLYWVKWREDRGLPPKSEVPRLDKHPPVGYEPRKYSPRKKTILGEGIDVINTDSDASTHD